jgi:hypothetical protein
MRRVRSVVLPACLACSIFLARAVPPGHELAPPTPEELAAGQALARQIRSAAPAENSQINATLIITAGGATREIPVACRVVVRATNWETDYDTAATAQTGAERLEVIHTTNGPNQYLYARAPSPSAPLPDLAPIAPADANIPLAGSDFSLADLGLEFLHWPVQRQLKDEPRNGEPCYVLQSENPRGGEIVRVRSDIDKQYGAPSLVYAYDSHSNVVKYFSIGGSSLRKINGRWQLEKMDIRNKKTGSHTELKFDLNQ